MNILVTNHSQQTESKGFNFVIYKTIFFANVVLRFDVANIIIKAKITVLRIPV